MARWFDEQGIDFRGPRSDNTGINGRDVRVQPAGANEPATETPASTPQPGMDLGRYARHDHGDLSVNDARDAIAKAYRQYLGRDATPQEIQNQLRGQGWQQGDRFVGQRGLTSVLGSIQRSPEAQRTTAPAATTASGDAPGGEITRANVSETLKRYGAPTAEHLQQAVKENPWLGSLVGGDKLRLSNGETWDVIHDVGGPKAAWQTLTGHTAAAAAAGPGGGMSGGVSLGSLGTQRLPTPAPFVPPNAADVMADPGVQFRQQQAQQALERSAAAKGTLLTGGTAEDLQTQAQGLASQEYGNAYNRALQAYGTNAQTPLSYFGANVNADLGYGNLALGNKQANNQYSLGLGNLNLATQGQNFNQGFSLAQLGYNAARDVGQFGGVYGQNAGDIYGQQGNANAAGRVGSANAYNTALGNIGNQALQAYYTTQYGATPYGYPYGGN